MKVYDVIVEHPNGACDLVKTEVSWRVAQDALAKVNKQLRCTKDGHEYNAYVTPTKNTLRKEFKVIK